MTRDGAENKMCPVNNLLSAVHQKMILDHKVTDNILIICKMARAS